MAATKVTPQVTGASASVVPPTGERVCERVCESDPVCKEVYTSNQSGSVGFRK